MSLSDSILAYSRTPCARVYLDGKRWRDVLQLRVDHNFGDDYARGQVTGRNPPVTPRPGMSIRWEWGYDGFYESAITGEVTRKLDRSYPDTWTLDAKDLLWRAARTKSVIVVDPINDVEAKDAAVYIFTHYTTIPSSKLDLPTLAASGSAMGGGVWVLGQLTPIQWGDPESGSGKVSALRAVQDIYGALGYWVYAKRSGEITAKQMDRRPAPTAFRVFQRGDGATSGTLLQEGAPEREEDPDQLINSVTVKGANTGVDGVQLVDTWRTDDTYLPSNADQDREFSYFLLEYLNESEAGVASVTGVAKRILRVLSRNPDVVRFRGKADPRIVVGTTIGVKDAGVQLTSQKNYFIYGYSRELDLRAGRFDDRYIADGGTGDQGYTTIPPPDAAFTWTLDTEGLNGDSVVAVFLDGSGSTSPTGEIVSYSWSTATTVYSGTSTTASGQTAVFFYLLSEGTAEITLAVTDTSSKTGSVTQTVDLTGSDGADVVREPVSGAAGAAWYITQDGGLSWRTETTNGDAVAVPPIGAGVDDRASVDSLATYGLIATRGSGGTGLRRTLDNLATASTNLASLGGAIRCLWVNEANPARVWAAVGDTPYRSTDGGATFTAMAKPAVGTDINWIMEDPAVDDSVFCLAGADMYNATAPTVGWATLYEGPVGATARQFVRSRDGQVTWICYTGAPAGEAAQRVETGAVADLPSVTDIRSLALDKEAGSLRATLYLVDGDDPPALYSVDGITGLSAVTSSQTFPAGATVQHLLASRQADVIYAADFDSVAVGTGAFRKYFPTADLLFLWKALDTGQQGHMLGLGGAVIVPAELLVAQNTIGGYIYHYTNGAWANVTGSLTAGFWRGIAASPTAPGDWIVWQKEKAFRTTDSGATWTEISHGALFTNLSAEGIHNVEYSPDGAYWALTGGAYDAGLSQHVGVAYLGTALTTTKGYFWNTTTSSMGLPQGLAWVDNDTIAWANDSTVAGSGHVGCWRKLTVSATGAPSSGTGTAIGDADKHFRTLDYAAGIGLVGQASDGTLWRTADLTAPSVDETFSGDSDSSVSATFTRIYAGTASGVQTLIPGGGVTELLAGSAVYFVRVDRQTRGAVAAFADSGLYLLGEDGTAAVPLPEAASSLAHWVEAITEPAS